VPGDVPKQVATKSSPTVRRAQGIKASVRAGTDRDNDASSNVADVLQFSNFVFVIDELLKHSSDSEDGFPSANTSEDLHTEARSESRRLDLLKQLRLFLVSYDGRLMVTSGASMGGFDNESVVRHHRICLSGLVKSNHVTPASTVAEMSSESVSLYGLYSVDTSKIAETRTLWNANLDQTRQLYSFYASVNDVAAFQQNYDFSAGASSQGKISGGLMINFDSCRDFLVDSGMIPSYIDTQVRISSALCLCLI
jgi:hypothetical protein